MELEQLKLNAIEFYETAEDSLKKERYNAAASNYYKSMMAICDYILFEQFDELPKNHTERFKTLELNFPEAYKVSSSLFNLYVKTYNLRVSKKEADSIKKGLIKLARHFKFEEIK